MRRFRPALWGSVAAIAGITATLTLGLWQLDRVQQRMNLAAEEGRLAGEPALRLGRDPLPAERLELRQVETYGRFEPHAMIFIDNRVRRGVVGYEVVMPLRVAADQSLVLVNRGWVAGTGDRRRLPEIATPRENVRVIGRAVVPGKRIYELVPEAAEGRVWQNLTIERYRSRMKIAIHSFLIQQSNDIGDDLLREWPLLDRGVDTQRSYALQWFALAGLITVVYLVLSLRRDAANS